MVIHSMGWGRGSYSRMLVNHLSWEIFLTSFYYYDSKLLSSWASTSISISSLPSKVVIPLSLRILSPKSPGSSWAMTDALSCLPPNWSGEYQEMIQWIVWVLTYYILSHCVTTDLPPADQMGQLTPSRLVILLISYFLTQEASSKWVAAMA